MRFETWRRLSEMAKTIAEQVKGEPDPEKVIRDKIRERPNYPKTAAEFDFVAKLALDHLHEDHPH